MWSAIAPILWSILALMSDACSPHKDVVRLVCPKDIESVASRSSVTALVSWNRTDFHTESTYPIRGLYQVVPHYGASATFRHSFTEGSHYVEYKAMDSVGNDAACSFTVTIRVVQCPALQPPLFGEVECDAQHLFGSKCSISCGDGHVAVGQRSVECLEDGHWSDELAYCRSSTCSDPGTPFHGRRKCSTSTHSFGSVCNFECFHGYQLLGSDRIVCRTSQNVTQWSARTPQCREIIPPKLEACPSDVIQTTTSQSHVEIQRPHVAFRTSDGSQASFTCSHFEGGLQRQNFSVGLHVVTCTAVDPMFGDKAASICQFTIRVRANPCRPLAQPMNGFLLCSRAHGGNTQHSPYDTVCRLFCDRGYILPRSNHPQMDLFECDHNGVWSPTSFVPSCVVPSRPLELKLPSEILYSTTNCTNLDRQTEVGTEFKIALLSIIRMQDACAANPKDCIVDDVITSCHSASRSQLLRTGSRRRRNFLNSLASHSSSSDRASRVHRSPQQQQQQQQQHEQQQQQQQQRQQQQDARTTRGGGRRTFYLSIQFHFATRLPSAGGDWPDEYHRASHRLFSVFDYFEQQVVGGTFSISSRVGSLRVQEVNDSLTYTPVRTICDLGYQFNENFLLCVPCGAGTFFNSTINGCVECPPGSSQPKQGQFHCN